jgi:putative MATE family efflux protein
MDNGLTSKPIPKLIKQIAIPASIGFFFHTMYNVVDTFYAGLISTEAIAALSLSFPIFFIIIALGSGLSTGTTALISNALGQNNKEKAKKYASQAVTFSVIVGILLTIVGFIISPTLFRILGAEEQYLQLSLDYMNVILLISLVFVTIQVLNSTLTSQGDTKTIRNFFVTGFFLNLILDPWFMFGGFGLPAMGLSGVAWATAVIEIAGIIYIGYKAFKSGLIDISKLKNFIPQLKPFKHIAIQGFPASLNMMTVAIGIFIITYFISGFGKAAVAAYGIATRVEQLALMPTIGLNIATLTLCGQNNGAQKFKRVKETLYTCIKYGTQIMIIGTIIIFLFSTQFMNLFTNDVEVITIGSTYLKIAAFIFVAYVVLFTSISGLQGMKKPMYALYIGLARQIVAPFLIFYVATQVLGLGIIAIWWGIFGITWIAAVITLWYANFTLKKLKK